MIIIQLILGYIGVSLLIIFVIAGLNILKEFIEWVVNSIKELIYEPEKKESKQ